MSSTQAGRRFVFDWVGDTSAVTVTVFTNRVGVQPGGQGIRAPEEMIVSLAEIRAPVTTEAEVLILRWIARMVPSTAEPPLTMTSLPVPRTLKSTSLASSPPATSILLLPLRPSSPVMLMMKMSPGLPDNVSTELPPRVMLRTQVTLVVPVRVIVMVPLIVVKVCVHGKFAASAEAAYAAAICAARLA